MTTNQEKNNLVERCNETAVCTRLQVRLESRALKGFFAVHSFDKDGKPVLHGVLYKQAAADEGEFIKVCPFCCHRPGRIEPMAAAIYRDKPAPSSVTQERVLKREQNS
ncbi:hypothetical protein MASR1M12_00710 [Erysipelotrichia bacterium]